MSTTDLYEASYYLLCGCYLERIEGEYVGDSISCRLTFRDEKLGELQKRYFAGEAAVPIFAFRRTFGQVNALVRAARKKARMRIERPRGEGMGP
ncbi:MAG: hypothetical protein IT186_17730 [Acidobacteria bacterium]|nr:hypothetical protein [Acidobacteriota bacterium]